MSDLKQELTQLKEAYETLGKRIEATEKKVAEQLPRAWPQKGDYYFYIKDGDIIGGNHTDHSVDYSRIERGNVYRTSAEAEKSEWQRIVIKKLRDLTNGFVANWREDTPKFFLYYMHEEKKWKVDWWRAVQAPQVAYFATPQDAQNAINTLGSELDVLL